MAGRTPPLYATGQWSVNSPFQVVEAGVYTCKAIRSFDEIRAAGVDPYSTYYEPLGLTRQDYETDVTNLANIVTLMSDAHPMVHVPDTYIASYPDLTTVPYRHIVLSLSLGAVPDSLVLDNTKTQIKELVASTLGIDGEVKLHQVGYVDKGFDQGTHETLEANRLSRIEETRTDYARVLEQQAELERLREQNETLVQILIAEGLLT